MKINDIVSKKEDVLRNDLTELRKKLEEARFQISTREEKNLKKIHSIKKDIARIMTILREKEIIESEKSALAEDKPSLKSIKNGKRK
ncbi:50S ribosomal protein L29 [bacterium (Candidatus Howlettbacteria) CG_4_10_14_0_8_um_filter_40_9]|nr:MAG: 50S ribosomal protein L29 [bacterium (Candidatus Howlettbacteria) CG_4_10_14_0_8_um_filter_40_9]